jgi:hypothetical protein
MLVFDNAKNVDGAALPGGAGLISTNRAGRNFWLVDFWILVD